ncbi:hypothetical protein G5I_14351 [Acromyrmex echinatior]|uniref:Uncharacterized protein n=1 Tax=Acromyrmex echinatior TaxID=103372 RepID=F4X7H2_ACREC|nr:hypothetical protein G5I_14351 [Acromyrmex echinatior]
MDLSVRRRRWRGAMPTTSTSTTPLQVGQLDSCARPRRCLRPRDRFADVSAANTGDFALVQCRVSPIRFDEKLRFATELQLMQPNYFLQCDYVIFLTYAFLIPLECKRNKGTDEKYKRAYLKRIACRGNSHLVTIFYPWQKPPTGVGFSECERKEKAKRIKAAQHRGLFHHEMSLFRIPHSAFREWWGIGTIVEFIEYSDVGVQRASMRERTPSADDTPKRAPPAPSREFTFTSRIALVITDLATSQCAANVKPTSYNLKSILM